MSAALNASFLPRFSPLAAANAPTQVSPDDNGVLNTRYTSCPPPRRADGCSDLCEPAAFHQSHAMQGSVGAAFYWTSGRNIHTAAFMQGILETTWPSEKELIGKTRGFPKRLGCSLETTLNLYGTVGSVTMRAVQTWRRYRLHGRRRFR